MEIIEIFSPITLFNNVDFPTFGRPTTVTNPDLYIIFLLFLLVLSLLAQNYWVKVPQV